MNRFFNRFATPLLAIFVVFLTGSSLEARTLRSPRGDCREITQGIDPRLPRLSWGFGNPSSDCQNEKQTGYKLVENLLETCCGKTSAYWDSGRLVSDHMAQNASAGKTSLSDRPCLWLIQIRNAYVHETSSPSGSVMCLRIQSETVKCKKSTCVVLFNYQADKNMRGDEND